MKLGDISRHRKFLEEYIEPDYGLLDKLRAKRALVAMEIEVIKKQLTSYERNCKIIEYLVIKQKYHLLTEALREAEQTHIVNYIDCNGEYSSPNEFGDDWPLNENELSTIDINYGTLVDLLDTSELITLLYSATVINTRQKNYIDSKGASHEKSEALLDIIRRRSRKDYKRTIQCLLESNQSHIATILDEGGVIVKVHSAHSEPNGETDETEDEIITKFKSIVDGKTEEELQEVMLKVGHLRLGVIAVKKDQSILLYIYCKTLEELIILYESQLSGELKTFARLFFAQLLYPRQFTEMTVEYLQVTADCAEPTNSRFIRLSQIAKFSAIFSDGHFQKCLSYFYGTKIRAVKNYEADGERIPEVAEAKPMRFQKGDLMRTAKTLLASDSEWLKVVNLGDGKIAFVPRKYFVIDYDTRQSQDLMMKEDRKKEKSQ